MNPTYWQAAQDFAFLTDGKSEYDEINDANRQVAAQMGVDLTAQPLGLSPPGVYQVVAGGRACKATIDGTILHLIANDAQPSRP